MPQHEDKDMSLLDIRKHRFIERKTAVAIVGSRSFVNYMKFSKVVISIIISKNCTSIISGGAEGTDSMAERFAKEKNIPFDKDSFLPDWDKDGKKAGLLRNVRIVSWADFLIIFWDGSSKGTKFTIKECERQNKPHIIYYTEKI